MSLSVCDSYVKWKAESFICGALLLTMASDTKYYIFICILIAAPYVFGFLVGISGVGRISHCMDQGGVLCYVLYVQEDNVLTGWADESSFGRLRQVMSWLNKVRVFTANQYKEE